MTSNQLDKFKALHQRLDGLIFDIESTEIKPYEINRIAKFISKELSQLADEVKEPQKGNTEPSR